ncbi:MAG TPA: Ig-like domain-containing protein, partial [Verrucomicrobiae bacterium]|nr:Ig-like domain-containing protein [Verrucomicrobiae bacterium]
AGDLNFTMKKNTSITVFYEAVDAENDQLTFEVLEAPKHGELWNYPAVGNYYPARGFFGVDSFTYRANDGRKNGRVATVSINVLNSNNPPSAVSELFLTKTNRSLFVQPRGEDLDDDAVTFEISSTPLHGAVLPENSGFRFTPEKDFLGEDSFTLRPFDGSVFGDPAVITVSVIATNATPSAQIGSAVVQPNTPAALTLSGSDPDGDSVTFAVMTQPLHGTLSGEPPKLTYTPATNYVGPDKFTFNVRDAFAETPPATFNLQVIRQNRPPKAEDQTISTSEGVALEIPLALIDPDLDPLRTVILKGPGNGLLYGSGTNFVYVPKSNRVGPDSFTYKGWDGQKFGNVARVTINVSLPPEEMPPSFTSIRQTGEVVELTIQASRSQPIVVESSTNLRLWLPAPGVIVAENEKVFYRETNKIEQVQFYRARRTD